MLSARARTWIWRAVAVLATIAVARFAYVRFATRAASLPLVTSVDGPTPAHAAGVIVFLHGRGSDIANAERMARDLRGAGLPPDIAIVLIEGPFSTGLGHAWGDTAQDQATSRARVRARLRDLFGENWPPPSRLVISGFSQGAGLAADIAVEEPHIGGLASFSPCYMWLRGELPRRADLRVLLAHGNRDSVCPVHESRSLAQVLEGAHRNVQYIEFDGAHTIPPHVLRALVAFATAP